MSNNFGDNRVSWFFCMSVAAPEGFRAHMIYDLDVEFYADNGSANRISKFRQKFTLWFLKSKIEKMKIGPLIVLSTLSRTVVVPWKSDHPFRHSRTFDIRSRNWRKAKIGSLIVLSTLSRTVVVPWKSEHPLRHSRAFGLSTCVINRSLVIWYARILNWFYIIILINVYLNVI